MAFGSGGGAAFGSIGFTDGSQQGLANQNAQGVLQRGNQKDIAQIGADAATLPARLQQQRFGQVFPWVQGQLGGLGAWGSGGGAAFGAGNTSPGQVGQQPQINAGPVWTQDQIQQQVNGQAAQNDAKTGGQVRDIQSSTAGRGFGSNSPLAQALGTMAQGQNTATNANMAQQTQWNAAQGNAQQQLAGQTAQENQFASRQNEDIERHKVIAGRQNALIAALAGMV
jgi:hypothetical protein